MISNKHLWAGKVFGTNTGNAFVELEGTDDGMTGLLRFMDDHFGPVVYDVTGTFDGTALHLSGRPKQAAEGMVVDEIEIKGAVVSDGNVRGQWSSKLGTGGAFILFPHNMPSAQPTTPGVLPEQIHIATRKLGALRLYADDVRALIEFIRRDFNIGRVAVTYQERGIAVAKYVNNFDTDLSGLGVLRYIKLAIQELDAYGINKVASVELNASGENVVQVQGIQEAWVVGKAESLVAQLQPFQKSLATTFRKFGLNVNGVLVLAMLVFLPDLSFGRRIVFIVFVVAIVLVVVRLHARFIPNVIINLIESKPSPIVRAWPQIISWVMAASAALAASVVYGLLAGELTNLTLWFTNLLR